MNGHLLWQLTRWEFRLLTRGAAFWLGMLAASGIAVNLAIRGVQSPSLVAYGMSNWTLPVIPLLFLPVLGGLRRRDEACGISELVHSRPVSGLAYVAGKFLAGWSALAATWLASMTTGGLVLAVTDAGALPAWPKVMLLSLLLVLPCFAFVAALALAVDALTGRAGAVLAVGTLVVLGSWLYLPSLRVSHLVPLFIPRYLSEVFGFDPYAGVMWANRAWVLSVTLGLLAFALWVLPRKIPLLAVPGAARLAAALLVAMIAGGTASAIFLLQVPPTGQWTDEARDWEMAQVRDASAGSQGWQDYWVRHPVAGESGPIEVFVAHGAEELAEPLGRAVERVLPYFRELQPPAGAPLRVFQGSYLRTGRLENGSLVVLNRDVRRTVTDQATRAVIRAMAEAYWSDLAGVPAELPGQTMIGHFFPFDLHDTWAAPAALYHQWVVLEQVAGAETTAQEIKRWRQTGRPQPESGSDTFADLYQSGAAAYGIDSLATSQALALWETGQKAGHDQVLSALRTAAAQAAGPAPSDVGSWQRARKPYWETVSHLLGVDLNPFDGSR